MRGAAQRSGSSREEGELLPEQDEHHAFIAGYTAAGFAYGVTWEEEEERAFSLEDDTDDGVPF